MTYAGVHFKHSCYIFCPIVKSNTGRAESLRIVLGKLESLGFSAKCYGPHGLRAGGTMVVVVVVANGGVQTGPLRHMATGNLILPRMFML